MANWKGTTVVSKLAKVLSYSSSAAWQYLTWIQQNQAINAPFQSQLLITQWNGAITWESIAITCCGNESVTEFVVFFLGLYHTQCCTRQFCHGICRRLLPACRRETRCKGACLALRARCRHDRRRTRTTVGPSPTEVRSAISVPHGLQLGGMHICACLHPIVLRMYKSRFPKSSEILGFS